MSHANVIDIPFSDNSAILCGLSTGSVPQADKRTVHSRNFRKIDDVQLKSDVKYLAESDLCGCPDDSELLDDRRRCFGQE